MERTKVEWEKTRIRLNYCICGLFFDFEGRVWKRGWWPERESTLLNFYGLISNIYQKGNRKGNIALRESKNRSCTFFHLPLHLSWDSFSQNLLK